MEEQIDIQHEGKEGAGAVIVSRTLGQMGIALLTLLTLLTLFCLSAGAQPAPRRFAPASTATQRFKNWRGAVRLPKVDLAKEPDAGDSAYEITDILRMRGGLGYQTEFSDNIFLVRGGAIPGRHKRPGDIFHIISPNIHLEMPGIIAPIILDYNADITRAGSFHEFDSDEHYLSGIMDVKIGHGLGIRLKNSLSHQMSPPSFPNRWAMWVDPATGGVREYNPTFETRHLMNYFWTNTSEAVVYYKSPNKLRIEGRFVHDLARFDARRNWDANYDIDTAGGEISYRISPRVNFLSEYYHDWDRSRRREHDRLAGGFEWDITAKLNGSAVAGYEWFHRKDGHNVGGWVGHAELTYDVSRKLRLGFYGDHSITEVTTLDGGVVQGAFESTSLSLNALYRLTEKVEFFGGLAYILDDLQAGATNELWVTSAGIRWQPREQWSFETKYQFQKYGPQERRSGFEENLFSFNAVYGF